MSGGSPFRPSVGSAAPVPLTAPVARSAHLLLGASAALAPCCCLAFRAALPIVDGYGGSRFFGDK